jgi:hypothetical protein
MERPMTTTSTAPAADAETVRELPPFTGFAARCPKCGYDSVSTEYRPPLGANAVLRQDGRLVRGPLPERQERECDRCRYTWDEAVGIEPELPTPLTEQELAYALNNSAPYPVKLHPKVAAAMAANLAQMLNAYIRPDYEPGDVEDQDVQAADDTPPAEPPGLDDLDPERAALVRVVHQATLELQDAHAHHLVPGVSPVAGQSARRVLRATALRLRRGEDTEAVLLATVTELAHVLAGGDGLTRHTLTGLDA